MKVILIPGWYAYIIIILIFLSWKAEVQVTTTMFFSNQFIHSQEHFACPSDTAIWHVRVGFFDLTYVPLEDKLNVCEPADKTKQRSQLSHSLEC